MTSQDEIMRTANRLKDALGAAAEVMTMRDSPVLVPERTVRHARWWLLPLTACSRARHATVSGSGRPGGLGRDRLPPRPAWRW